MSAPRPRPARPLGVFLGLLFSVFVLLSAGGPPARALAAAGSTYQVTTLADDGSAGSLRAAVTSANADSGATITFASSAHGTILLGSALPALAADMTIQGPGASVVAVDGAGKYRPFSVNGGVTAVLSGLTIQNGNDSGDGGGVNNAGSLTLTGCTLAGNSTKNGGAGGGVYNANTATLTACTLTGNSTTTGGGVYNAGNGALTLTGCTLTQNSAGQSGGSEGTGGGISNAGTATLTGCTLIGNNALDANAGGGGVSNLGTVTLTACALAGNTANNGNGGGVYNNSTAVLTGCTLTQNSVAYFGAGAFNDRNGTLTLTDDILYGDNGGELDSTAHATYCDIAGYAPAPDSSGNFGADPQFVSGAAPYDLHLKAGSPCLHAGNSLLAGTLDHDGNPYAAPKPSLGAYEYGSYTVTNTNDSGAGSLRAAITYANLNAGTTITFKPGLSGTILLASKLPALAANMTFMGPGASVIAVDGVGKYRPFSINSGVTAALSGLTIQNGNDSGDGGGVNNAGTVTLTGCTLTGNSAFFGGGVLNEGALTLTGCTLTGNSVYQDGGGGNGVGGGVFNNENSAGLTLTDDILYGDTAPAGSEIGGAVTASHCDIAGYAAAPDANGNFGADPRLAPLGDYGGPTRTFALLPGSPCLGAGIAVTGVISDQRGVAVPFNGRYDIGAFESRGFKVIVTDGSPQSALVGTHFPQNLTATVVANVSPEPVAGGLLAFTGPAAGASAAFDPGLVLVGGNGTGSVKATANGTPGGPYTVTADTGAGSADYRLTNTATAPAVTTNPVNKTVIAGQTATFTAAASGSPAPSVQWQVSTDAGGTFSDITGATSTTLTLASVTAAQDDSQYRAVFTNSAGTATTDPARLTVYTPPVVTANPVSQAVAAGGTATFTAAASGKPAPSVRWQISTDGGSTFADISGATNTTYSFTATVGQSGSQYRAVFTSGVGSATTTAAALTVTPALATRLRITAPAGATAGQPFAATVTALDANGNTVTGDTRTVSFTSTDPRAALPAPVALVGGTATVTVTDDTAGTQTMTASAGGLASGTVATASPPTPAPRRTSR